MKIVYTVIIILFASTLSAQSIDFAYRDSILNKRSIQVSAINTFTTNSINNELLGKFIYGGQIGTELITNNGQKKFNVLGGEFEQSISYFEGSFLPSKPAVGLVVSVSDQHFASASFKPDIYNLAFRGNTPYLDDTLDFSYAHGQYLHYQNYSVGVYDKRTQSYVKLGFLVGNESINYRLGNSIFHTSSDGNDLFLQADMSGFNTKNDSSDSYFTAKGYGFALEINHNFIINSKSGKQHIVNFNLSNLGSIFWGNSTQNRQIDTTYLYNGFNYSNINNIGELNTAILADSLNINTYTSARREALPIQIIINKTPVYSLTQKWQSLFGFKALLIPDYRPMVFGGVYFQPNDFFSVSTRAIIGGYGGLRFGLNANLWLKENFFIGLSTLNVIGVSSNTIGKGTSANISLQYNF
ncbi:MAG: hypothetical protein R3279_03575 [Putridiphycobacter sp.]|nr:hypothetical protein [Putridiphycobacter sp.]